LIYAIYILSNDGKPIFTGEYSESGLNVNVLTNFVSAVSDFSNVFSQEKSNNGFSSVVLGENGFLFHRSKEFTFIAVVDPELGSSDKSKVRKIYKKFLNKYRTIVSNGERKKDELKAFENEVLKIVEGNTGGFINFQAIEEILWDSVKNPLKKF